VKPFPFLKLEEPSDGEMEHAADTGREVVAISSINDSDRMFLKLLCRSGEQTVVWLDAFLVDHLTRHFEKALIGKEREPFHPVRTQFVSLEVGSLGIVPRDKPNSGST
jgi:hypothetical protein